VGAVYAEPLVARGRLVVATESNRVYAFGAATGEQRWRASLGAPVPSAEIDAATSAGCSNIDPTGITGTPVVDRKAGVVYAAAMVREPIRHELVALDLASGHTLWRRTVDPPGVDPRLYQQRAALAVSSGRVYVAYGGTSGDCGDYKGTVVGTRTSGKGPLVVYSPPVRKGAGIWAPSGPAVGPGADLFVATGNSDRPDFDYGDSVIRLTPGLRPVDFFAPADNGWFNETDQDLGSVGPLLLPKHRAFIVGKSGDGFLLDARHLGGIGHPVYRRDLGFDSYGGLAYADGSIFVPFRLAGVWSLRLDQTMSSFSVAWRGPVFRAGPPVVAGRAVWALDLDAGTLYAFGRRHGKVRFTGPVGAPAQFSTPTAAGGRVYVAAGGHVIAFGDG
jgi:outer membrane protein assembly factor BamB